jgi:hypothetical protein
MLDNVRNKGWMREALIVGLALLLGLAASEALGADRPERKMVRQIGVMESIVDQMLVDSPNLLIFGRDVTRGLYIDGFGAVFTFEASLVEKDKHDWEWGNFPFKIKEQDGKRVIIIEGDEDLDEEKIAEKVEEAEKRDARRGSIQEELYKAGKAEIVETMIDYGETMSALKPGEHLAIAAYLRDASYFTQNKISRLVLKAKIDDLRAYSEGKISEEEMVKRIRTEEY